MLLASAEHWEGFLSPTLVRLATEHVFRFVLGIQKHRHTFPPLAIVKGTRVPISSTNPPKLRLVFLSCSPPPPTPFLLYFIFLKSRFIAHHFIKGNDFFSWNKETVNKEVIKEP